MQFCKIILNGIVGFREVKYEVYSIDNHMTNFFFRYFEVCCLQFSRFQLKGVFFYAVAKH